MYGGEGRGGSLRGWGRGRRGMRGEVQSMAGPIQGEGRGAREGIRVQPGCRDRPESLRPVCLQGAQDDGG